VEAFPDLTTLSDADLKQLISDLQAEENEISYKRRLLHGRIDILHAELVARLKNKGEGELAQVDVDRLSEILAGKAARGAPTQPAA
jgi:RsiG-like